VKTFVFKALQPRLFRYLPGQFLTFEFEIGGERISRCYTLASPPTRPHLVAITVKRTRGGVVSNWLHETMAPGRTVKAVGPMGDFTNDPAAPGKYLFLAGGVGITPVMSMARAQVDLSSVADAVLIQSARSSEDLLFAEELKAMEAVQRGFRAAAIYERGAPAGGWSGLLDLPRLQAIVPDFLERRVFCCGPEGYMAAVRAMLAEAGFDMARYHQESFDFAALPLAEAGAVDKAEARLAAEGRRHRVLFQQLQRAVDCEEGQFVLDAARAAGIRLPSSCTKGVCGTCKSRLVSGTVAMTPAGGIRQREIDQGMILLCCSKPTSDLVVER
jgi:ferredoxin-NADP reductase